MAEPASLVLGRARRALEEIRDLTEDIEALEREIPSCVRRVERMRQELTGQFSAPLVDALVKKVKAVRRAADAVRLLADGRDTYSAYEYFESLSRLAGFLENELDTAIALFATTERNNPSALRSREHGQVISMPIDEKVEPDEGDGRRRTS
ncbi:hypothetical protein P1S61_39515 [Streptomyces sp. ME08-AFT2]|uniref:hypothetical protein n=1 Tax=Streptomyces sp. ME08-AFT2 TaxID=3028683 RepID=UPI0029A61A7E|nr:hypothetical protein [Streptomyces sp. ME08-AFT2]MDX3315043.1 hypothetical protein [Streptomyces sp. ME08-AFT2]